MIRGDWQILEMRGLKTIGVNDTEELRYGMHESTAFRTDLSLSAFLLSSISGREQIKLTRAGVGDGKLFINISRTHEDKE